MTDWAQVMRAVCPRAKPAIVAELAPHFDQMFDHYKITPGEEQAEFICHSAHETAGFTTLVEFGPKDYFRRYDGRKDLGNTKPGFGWLYRGRGIFQLTGYANYKRYGALVGEDLVRFPNKAAEGYYAAALACIYWCDRNIGPSARAGDIRTTTRKINGGLNGLRERQIYLAKARKVLAIAVPAAAAAAAGVGFLSVPLEEQDVPTRAEVRAVQLRLASLGYHMVGNSDGIVGTGTVAAISAFQHDNGLDTTGHLDAATRDAIMDDAAENRPIPETRADGAPSDSTIVANARTLFRGAAAIGGGGALTAANEGLSKVEAAKGFYDRIQGILEPFAAIKAAIFSPAGLSILLVAGAIALAIYAHRIRAARIEDYRSAKTA